MHGRLRDRLQRFELQPTLLQSCATGTVAHGPEATIIGEAGELFAGLKDVAFVQVASEEDALVVFEALPDPSIDVGAISQGRAPGHGECRLQILTLGGTPLQQMVFTAPRINVWDDRQLGGIVATHDGVVRAAFSSRACAPGMPTRGLSQACARARTGAHLLVLVRDRARGR